MRNSTEFNKINKLNYFFNLYSASLMVSPFLEDELVQSAILKVPIAEADHVRTGWWIDFQNISFRSTDAKNDDSDDSSELSDLSDYCQFFRK